MKSSEFWLMCKRNEHALRMMYGSDYPGSNLPTLCIVELTPDEMIYIWPSQPKFDSLCFVCEYLDQRGREVCKPETVSCYPCRFRAVPEAELPQDFDDFLVDGDYLAESGYFYSFHDFRKQNGYSDEYFSGYKLGALSSVREARKMLNDVTKAAMGTF